MELVLALISVPIAQNDAIRDQLRRMRMDAEMHRSLIVHHLLLSSASLVGLPEFYEIIFLLLEDPQIIRPLPSSGGEVSFSDYHYWHTVHRNLSDDNNPRTSYRTMYRMDRATFEKLVNDLSTHPVYQLTAPNAIPPYIQISYAIWHFSNCHIGYRAQNVGWGTSHGSYINMTRRFCTAVEDIYGHLITWPNTSLERIQQVQTGFEYPRGESGPRRLPRVAGALDGKNIPIHAPSPPSYAEYWRDKKGQFSVKLTAVCDDKCRFTYISVGDSGRSHDVYAFGTSL